MSRSLRTCASLAGLFVALLFAAPVNAQTTPRIVWEVANRFRLFKNEDQFRAIAAAGLARTDAAASSPAMATELELEQRAEGRTLGFGQSDEVAQYGWAAAVDSRTCFLSRNRGHRGCKLTTGDDFLKPRHFDALARIEGSTLPQGKTCTWSVPGLAPVSADCGQQVRLTGLSFATPFSISVSESATEVARLDGQSARSVVIVGLGDSFASGEGNPDRPAQFKASASDYGRTSRLPDGSRQVRYYPLRIGASTKSLGTEDSAAVWLNAQCHRSLYSHQLKAALQLAIEERHLAVTFLGYACTGAEVTTGILDFQAARANVDASVYDAAPQIVKYLRDACADGRPYNLFRGTTLRWQDVPRCKKPNLPPVDAILVSIGGNDVGFSRVIAHETVDTANNYGPLRGLLYRIWLRTASPIDYDDAEKLARQELPKRFPPLKAALRKLIGPAPIIQTAYPQMTETGPGTTCPQTADGMDLHNIFGWRSTTGVRAVSFLRTFNGLIKDAINLNGDSSWSFVDTHVEGFSGHAICVGGAPSGSKWRAMSGEMRFPTWMGVVGGWQGFEPENWVAYSPRNRWFVTPNDAFLTANTMDITSPRAPSDPRDPVQPVYAATLSGSFHPNALGQAAIADAMLPELRRALGLSIAP